MRKCKSLISREREKRIFGLNLRIFKINIAKINVSFFIISLSLSVCVCVCAII